MLFQEKIANLVTLRPQLSRVWIKTGDPRMPLKSVWIDESRINARAAAASRALRFDDEAAACAEGHLAMAA